MNLTAVISIVIGSVTAVAAVVALIWKIRFDERKRPAIRVEAVIVNIEHEDGQESRSYQVTVYNIRGIDLVLDRIALRLNYNDRFEFLPPDRSSVPNDAPNAPWHAANKFPPLPLKGYTNLKFWWDNLESQELALRIAAADAVCVDLGHGDKRLEQPESLVTLRRDSMRLVREALNTAMREAESVRPSSQ